MRMKLVLALVAATAIAPTAALAQYTQEDAAHGAAAGGAVAGPVGAAAGAIVGGTVGAASDIATDIVEPPPPPVVTYVERERIPSVRVEREVVIGQPLPETVVIHPVPHHERYAYAVVNDERVIVEPHSRKVIKIIRE